MPAKRSMTQVYLISMILLAMVPAVILIFLWMADEYQRHELRLSRWSEVYLEAREELLQQEVERTVKYIEFKRAQLSQRNRQDMQARVEQNYSLVSAIYQERAGKDSPEDIIAFILDIVRASQYPVEKGGYSIFRGDGTALFSSGYPLVEGSNIRGLEDLQGKQVFREMEAIIRRQGEGFVEVSGLPQGVVAGQNQVLVYVKYFEPLDLLLGTGLFVGVLEENVKREVIGRLSSVTYDPDFAVLHISDANDEVLVNQFNPGVVGSSQSQLQKALGPELEESYRQAINTPGGAFIRYEFENGNARSPVLNFVYRYPDWQWEISAGFLLDELDEELALASASMEETVLRQLVSVAITLFIIILGAITLAQWLAKRAALGFESFSRFFNDASKSDRYLDENNLPYTEFLTLAESANSMIDERRRYEKALRVSEQHFGLALEVSKHYLWEIDTQQRTLNMHGGFFESLGYSDGVYQAPQFEFALEICHPDDIHKLKMAMEQSEATREVNQLEYRLKDIHGVYHWFLSRGGTVKTDDDGRSLLSIGTTTEITRQKIQEQELVEARVLAEDANHAKSQFVATMSHELRTPLNGILGFAQLLLKDKNLTEDQRKSIDSINQCGEGLLLLISDVLDLSDIETTNLSIVEASTNLVEFLQNISDIVRYKAELKGLKYLYEIEDSVPNFVLFDAVKIKQILVNLLSNAIKYTEQGQVKILVSRDAQEGVLCFEVIDTGIGIEHSKLDRIFKPFQKIDEIDGLGTGLGLTICKRLAEAVGGNLMASSEIGRGSSFTLLIPLKPVDHSASEPPGSSDGTAYRPNNVAVNKLKISRDKALPDDVHRQLAAALSLGDINLLQALLKELAVSRPDLPWLRQCQQLLDDFNLEAISQLLSDIARQEDMV